MANVAVGCDCGMSETAAMLTVVSFWLLSRFQCVCVCVCVVSLHFRPVDCSYGGHWWCG